VRQDGLVPEQIVRWERRFPAALTGCPVLADGLVLVGDWGGRVRALDAADGRTRWTVDLPAAVLSPVSVAGGTVYASAADAALHARELATGRLLWRRQLLRLIERGPHSPTSTAGLLFCRTQADIWALDPATGEPLWSVDAWTDSELGRPVVVDGLVIFATVSASTDGVWTGVQAVDAKAGEPLWEYYPAEDDDDPVLTPLAPAAAGSRLYTFEGRRAPDREADAWVLLELDAATGRDLGRVPLPDGLVGYYPPVVTHGHAGAVWFVAVHMTASGDVVGGALCRAVPAASRLEVVLELPAPPTGPPVPVDASLYVATSDGVLRCIDGEAGRERWQFATEVAGRPFSFDENLEPSFAVGEDVVCVQTRNSLVAIEWA
jgi:outer membrane protein assembly factor BamB